MFFEKKKVFVVKIINNFANAYNFAEVTKPIIKFLP